jgi:hypothetical protein
MPLRVTSLFRAELGRLPENCEPKWNQLLVPRKWREPALSEQGGTVFWPE